MGITGIVICPIVFSSRATPDLISAAPGACRNQSWKSQLHFEYGYGLKHLNTALIVLNPKKKHIVPNTQKLRASVCWVHIGQFVYLWLKLDKSQMQKKKKHQGREQHWEPKTKSKKLNPTNQEVRIPTKQRPKTTAQRSTTKSKVQTSKNTRDKKPGTYRGETQEDSGMGLGETQENNTGETGQTVKDSRENTGLNTHKGWSQTRHRWTQKEGGNSHNGRKLKY